jgi:hypothetical protein
MEHLVGLTRDVLDGDGIAWATPSSPGTLASVCAFAGGTMKKLRVAFPAGAGRSFGERPHFT